MSDLSLYNITSRVLEKQTKDKITGSILSKDIKGKNSIDANSDNNVTLEELIKSAELSGIDVSNLNSTDLENLSKDAIQLTQFLQKGGKIYKNDDNIYNYSFVENNNVSKIEDLKISKDKEIGFSRGQSGPEIAKLNILLSNLGFKIKPGEEDKFTEETEIFVRKFQTDNNLLIDKITGLPNKNRVAGVIDSETLITMERATKLANPYEIQEKENLSFTEYDNIRQKVKNQLLEKVVNVDKSFKIGEKLTEGIVGIDRKMSSESLCYTAVKKSFEQILGMEYKYFGFVTNPETGKKENGAYAKTASYTLLDNNPMFVKLEGFSRKDVQFLPPGSIVVYRPIDSKGKDIQSEPGHIGVQTLQVNGLPVIQINEENNIMKELIVKNRNNTTSTYKVMNEYAVLTKDIQDNSEIEIGKKINRLTIVGYEKDGENIKSIKVKGIGNKGTYYKNLPIEDNKIILEKYKIEHADISDKMRVSPWKNSKVEVYFPVDSIKNIE